MAGKVARFRALRLLAQSRAAQVFVARDREARCLVALKVLAPWLVRELAASGRMRDACTLSDAKPPGIVAAKVVCPGSRGAACVATALLEGRSLADRIARGPLPCADAIAICLQVGHALREAQDCGVQHGHVAASNVFIVPDVAEPRGERALVGDFGTNAARGVATDARDLGSLLHELITGVPYAGETIAELIGRGLAAAVAILVARTARSAPIERVVDDLELVATSRAFDLDPTETKLPLRAPPRAVAAPTPMRAVDPTCAFARVELDELRDHA